MDKRYLFQRKSLQNRSGLNVDPVEGDLNA